MNARVVYTCECILRRFLFFFFSERMSFLGVFSKRARQRPRCDIRGAACNHLNQCTYTLYHSIIIYTRCTARTAERVPRRYFIRKHTADVVLPRYPSISSLYSNSEHSRSAVILIRSNFIRLIPFVRTIDPPVTVKFVFSLPHLFLRRIRRRALSQVCDDGS